MKNTIIVLVILVVIAGIVGYVVKSRNTSSTVPSTTNNQVSGKLNINAVCDGALAYMTFPDSASADIFVSDCKEGKHPEVIERYKAQLNVGEGAAI